MAKYVSLQTAYYLDPAVLGLSDAAEIMFVRGLAYCGNAETGGFIPDAAIQHLTRMKDARTLHRICMELVSGAERDPLWIRVTGGWRVAKWDKNQESLERLISKRKADAERQRKHRGKAVQNGTAPPPAEPGKSDIVTRDSRARSREESREVLKPLTALVRRQLFGDARGRSTTDDELIGLWSEMVGTADLATELRAWLIHNAGTTLNDPAAALLGWLRTAARRAGQTSPGCSQCIRGWLPDEFGQPGEHRCAACRPHLQAVNE